MISRFVVNSIWIYPTLMREAVSNFVELAPEMGVSRQH